MFLLVCATEMEIRPLRLLLQQYEEEVSFLVGGVGIVETAMNLASFLAKNDKPIDGTINCGAGGAFLDTGVEPLDICLAEKEVFGDFGICFDDEIRSFDHKQMLVDREFDLNSPLFDKAQGILKVNSIEYKSGNFVTVNCVSGTEKRGQSLRDKHQGLCENMEGAAVARVCKEFDLQCLEIRCISNFVEDRDVSQWKLDEAAQKCAEVVAKLMSGLIGV